MFKHSRVLCASMILGCILLTGCGKTSAGSGNGSGSIGLMYNVSSSSAEDESGIPDGVDMSLGNIDGSDGSLDDTNNTVTFGLTSVDDPNFSDIDSEGLYTIEGGYAYAIDPVTLDKVGPALDPLTKEPVTSDESEPEDTEEYVEPEEELEDGTYGITSIPEEQHEIEEVEPPIKENSSAEIPESAKLPNTGIFLEDD